jgi:hypothetical protein
MVTNPASAVKFGFLHMRRFHQHGSILMTHPDIQKRGGPFVDLDCQPVEFLGQSMGRGD